MPQYASFITTPIFYANAKPHIGHAYTLCVADAWSRYTAIKHHPSLQAFPPKRVLLRPPIKANSFLSTGVDEHGTKIARMAAVDGKTPQELCDQVSGQFENLCDILDVQKGVFVRTTSGLHQETVFRVWRLLESSRNLYWSKFAGWYSAIDEAFYGDWEVEEVKPSSTTTFASNDKPPVTMRAKSSGNTVEWIEEETCRFKLSPFKPRLHEWLDSGVFPSTSPEHTRLLGQLHVSLDQLEDPSISRPRERVPWGIPVPGHNDHTIYVWFDALTSYLTAGNVSLDGDCRQSQSFLWPPEVQFIGKDIIRFHGILWPAMLMAIGAPLPKKIITHGHILVDGTKMSKSLGNVLSPIDVINNFVSRFTTTQSLAINSELIARDCLRYILIRSATLNEDTTFSLALARRTVNTELVNWLGNLLSRITSKRISPTQTAPMLEIVEAQHFLSHSVGDAELFKSLVELPGLFESQWDDHLHPNRSIDAVMDVVRQTNTFVDRHKPWDEDCSISTIGSVVGVTLEALRLCGCLLWPVMPTISDGLLTRLGITANRKPFRSSQWQLSPMVGALVPRLN